MIEPTFDADGYPSEEALQRIESWEWRDAGGCLDYVKAAWHWQDFGVSNEISAGEASVVRADAGKRYLRLATGGWSGNESLIAALKQNRLVWSFTWRLSAVGGLHIFQYLEESA